MGKTFEEFVLAKQVKIQTFNNYLFLLQLATLVLSLVMQQVLLKVELPVMWFVRLAGLPVFYELNQRQRFSQWVTIFQISSILLLMTKLTVEEYSNFQLLLYVYLSCYYMVTFISYTQKQAFVGIFVVGSLWVIGVILNGALYKANVLDILTFFMGNGIMLVLTNKLKSDEYLAFKYQKHLKNINEMQTDSLVFSPDGLLVINQDNEVLLANDTIKQFLKLEYGKNAEISKRLNSIEIEKGRLLLEALWKEETMRLNSIEWKSKKRSKDNQLIISAHSIQHFLDDIEKQRQLTDIAQQLADLRNREHLLEQSEHQISLQLLEKERQQLDFMNEFLRFCSHEFKTPTNSLISFLDIVRNRDDLDLETKELLNIAHVSSKQILYLATNLIDYSCLVAQQFSVNKTEVELSDVLAECDFMIQILAQQKGIRFAIEVSASCPATIFTDANRLKQILLNLLGNSVKFTKKGIIRLCVQPSIADHLNFMISDTGIGIKSAEISQIFEQFTKLDDATLNSTGSGFGLHISNLLLKSLGSEMLEVQSTYGKGSKFFFDLPILQEHAIRCTSQMELNDEIYDECIPDDSSCIMDTVNSELSCPLTPTAVAQFSTISDINIGTTQTADFELQTKLLIVDDTALNRMVLTRIIQQEGDFAIMDVSSGQQAIDTIVAIDQDPVAQPFDLIFMDIDMPGMDGWETTENLIQQHASGQLSQLCPIVAHTAYSSQKDLDQCWESGMSYILPKPATREELRVMFAKLLPEKFLRMPAEDRSKSVHGVRGLIFT